MSTGTGPMNRVMLAVGKLPFVRVFRNNTGMAWVGDWKRLGPNRVLIENARVLHAGLVKGGSDLIGWTSKVVTPEMVGTRVAIFTAIEAKSGRGSLDDDQARFIRNVLAAGGIAGEARSEADALELVGARHPDSGA